MSANSNNNGRAYEYAWINALYKALSSRRNTIIINNSSLVANQNAWNIVGSDMQEIFTLSAQSAVDTILELEPCLTEVDDSVLELKCQKDGEGIKADVRDIVIRRNEICWEIGLSIKHNHSAVKHSRLSHRLDFGKEWFDNPCSKTYWEKVTPVFNKLKDYQMQDLKWSDLPDKDKNIYVPLLHAFMAEINNAYLSDKLLPQKMVEYLIGVKDYYKVVSHDNKQLTLIHSFNMHNTLNKPSKVQVSAITVPVVALPTEIIQMRFKPNSTNTVEVYLNNGWQLSFRIHNASTKVEPSLKFDVQFIGTPTSILTIECRWHKNK